MNRGDEMENFNNYRLNKYKYYDGNNGKKICLMDENNIKYMLKTPPSKKGKYTNGCISEDLGSKIFSSMGFHAQETKLGIYCINGKEEICVLCKDFETNNRKLVKFAELKNGVMETPESGFGVELSSVLSTIEEQEIIDPIKLKEFFWDMFIGDALLGNFDRHNGNWGFLIDEANAVVDLAPIYDCGSCLYSQMTDEVMKKVLVDETEKEARVYVFPNSALKIDNVKINYFNFISSGQNKDCTEALKRITPRIDLEIINKIIDNTEGITELQKQFYKTILEERKTKILEKSLEILLEKEKEEDLEDRDICTQSEV